MSSVGEAEPDLLGEDWVARTLALRPDGGEAPPVATLVSRRGGRRRARAVLYIHGFVDYFFQAHHAREWEEHGYDFYALDLRDYGRSIRQGRQANWIDDLATYDEELTAALDVIRAEGHESIVLNGHSTGGLIVSLYAADHAGSVDALVLNSPWLDLNSHWFDREISSRAIIAVGPRWPHLPVSTLGEAYGRSIHASTGGEWDYDLALKPLAGFPIHAGWLRAIRLGHRRVARGLTIDVPVLVATSGRSGHRTHPTEADLAGADCVLDVEQMHALAPRLGEQVTARRVPGGLHDLTLSSPRVRALYSDMLFEWLDQHLPG